jgi:hypothetical protein
MPGLIKEELPPQTVFRRGNPNYGLGLNIGQLILLYNA